MASMSDYEDRAYKAILALEKKYESQVIMTFKIALEKIRLEIAKIYEKYAIGGILTKSEMSKYNRLSTLEKTLVDIINPATKQVQSILYKIPSEIYGESFYLYAWAVDQSVNARLTWGQLNKQAVISNLNNELDTIAIQKYGPNARVAIRTAINNGLIVGQSFPQMMQDIKKFINVTNYQALRILKTEAISAQNAAQTDAYIKARANGVSGDDVWDSTLDGRTRLAHGSADGQKRDKSGVFSLGGEKTPYPGWAGLSASNRIQCRCRVRFQIDGFEPQIRRIKDEGIVPYQTYSEWKKDHKTWS